ncbi:glutaredoxin family protein [Gracilibacillus sp. YIM 98692]|uniref:glutaredoxin family protein n=1 Tax=Gracilibacillus sp. YIM 98692 TaxID=2663532 RepID=UPI0013D8264E|nr:glutaredoxin family protein [Gracilibacillus sp. YIM 98692]
MKVQLLGKEPCGLCEDALLLLQVLKQEYLFDLEEINIYNDDELIEKYHLKIPVVLINGQEVDYGQVNIETVEAYLKKEKFSENS